MRKEKFLKILKFGGTSLKDSNTIRSVMEIIKSNNSCAIVVSAVLGTTDQLLNLIQLAEVGESYSFDLKRIINFHKDLSNDLGIIDNYSSELKNINYFEDKLSEYLNLIISGNSCLPNIRDEILSQGEYLSACLISKLCIKEGLSSIYFDAKDLILTDNNFGNANVLYQESKEKIRKKFKGTCFKFIS